MKHLKTLESDANYNNLDLPKNRLLSVLNKLENEDIKDFYYSLTIDYKKIVEKFKYERINLFDIKNTINSYDEIETYNLTIYNYGSYDENRYKKYYHNVDLIFHSDGVVLNFTSKYVINRELEVTIDNLFKIYDEHIRCSKSLYDVINNF